MPESLALPQKLLEACERVQLRIQVVPFESADVLLTKPWLSIHGRPHLLLADRLSPERMEEEVRHAVGDLD